MRAYWRRELCVEVNNIICGNTLSVLKTLPAESINCVVTSPPYWGLRDYGIESVIWDGDKDCKHVWGNKTTTLKHKSGEMNPGKESWFKDRGGSNDKGNCFCLKCNAWRGSLGIEPTFELYIKHLCDIFDEVKRVLRKDGTCWVNLGDTYGGSGNRKGHTLETSNLNRLTVGYGATEGNQKTTKGYEKSLLMIPQRFAIEMVNRGWILRNTLIWKKPNCMPSSAKDRFTVDFEYVYFFTKNSKTQFWTNGKTGDCVRKQPLGTKGIEGKDWEWNQVGVITDSSFNIRVRDTEKDKYTQKATKEESQNYKKPRLKKVSLWTGHDYWFEQQFEEHLTKENRADGIIRNRVFNYDSKLNKLRGYKTKQIEEETQGPQHHGKNINYGKQGRNKRAVWTIPTKPFPEAHFAVYPEKLIEPMIKAGCPRYVCKKCGKAREKILEYKVGR